MAVKIERVQRSYWNDGTCTVDFDNEVQVFSMTVPEAHAERVEALLPACAYGDGYRRGVADSLGTYYRILRNFGMDDLSSCEYWLAQAEGAR